MGSCSLLAFGQIHIIVTTYVPLLTSIQSSHQVNQSMVTWQHST